MTLETDSDKDVFETVQVALRIRPLVDSEISRGCQVCVETIPDEPQVQVKGMAFTYNYVFPSEVSQENFYNDSIKGLVKRLQKGYNVTILAYGQTGSGKTYSMGTAYSSSHCKFSEAGVIPRAVSDIFDFIDTSSDIYDFKVKVSFIELYQEQLYDLLSNKSRDQSIIDIREENRVIVLPGLTEEAVTSVEDTMKCLMRGSDGRATGATAMNSHSSRSHAIFTIHIFKENKENRSLSTSSKFHLVDLAGSERSKKTKATGDRFREGVKINQGLLALGNVISALGDGSNRGFVGYRDSKLTRLLQDSLGGNSMTLMIACVSPADYNLEETVSTLRYADRARHIRNKPIVNQDPKAAEILRLNNLVQQLRLQIVNEGCGIAPDSSEILKQLQEEKRKNAELWEKYQEVLSKNKKLTCELQKSLNEHTSMIERAFIAEASKDQVEKKLCELTEECNQTIEHLKELGNKTEGSVNEEAYTSLCNMRSKILDLQSEQKQCSRMISKLTDEDEDVKTENDDSGDQSSPGVLDESGMNEKEEAHALNQAAKNDQLKDLLKSLNEKMNLAAELSANNQNLIMYNENVKESESRIVELEKEKEKLLQQLKTQQKSKLDPKIVDERRAKIQQLESEINELKKKCQHQANLIRMKEKNDLKIAQLSNEIQQMKSAKVRMIRSMRAESERFRTWKLQNEKRIVKLCNNDRKLQSDMVKMENKHAKLQNVLKRRVEEAVSTNKRLKEALERQKNAQKNRNVNTAGKEEVVQHWINEELELKGSLALAEHTLKGLMDDRGTLTSQLETLKAKDPSNPNINALQEDILLRNAQISDLQQKILVGNQENKSKNKWDTMHSMVEAKCALKYLFEVATEAKCEMQLDKFKQNQETANNVDLKEEVKKYSQAVDKMEEELEKERMKHKRQLAEVDKQYEEKITTLIKQLNCDKTNSNNSADNGLLERLKILQDAYDRALDTKDKLEAENNVLRTKNKNLNSRKGNKKREAKHTERKSYNEINWNDSDEGSDDSLSKDPNWALTPVANRKHRPAANSSEDDIQIPLKRSSDGQTKCTCKTSCAKSRCGCQKLGALCNSNCKCKVGMCLNRDSSKLQNSDVNISEDLSESNEGSGKKIIKIDNEDVMKKVRFNNDENDSSMMNREKKKRSFFYPDD